VIIHTEILERRQLGNFATASLGIPLDEVDLRTSDGLATMGLVVFRERLGISR
jgi:hypothetical protein